MTKKLIGLLAAVVMLAGNAFATTTTDKQIDSIQNSSGGSALAVPGTGSTLVTDSNTVSLTNKSIVGSEINSGTVAVSYGGTGANSFTSNGIIYGNTTSALQVTAAGTQYQVLQAGSGGVPAFGAVALSQSAAVTGQLPVANGGTGASSLTQYGVLMGNGTSAVSVIGPSSSSGYVLTSTGASSAPTFQAIPSVMPTINGTAASPLSVSAAGGVSLSTPTYFNVAFIEGANSGSNIVTATPSITACTAAGQVLYLVSESASKLVTLQTNADLSGSQLLLNGPWTSGENNSNPYTIELICDGAGTPEWVEFARNN